MALVIVDDLDLIKVFVLLRVVQALVTAQCVAVHHRAADVEAVGKDFRRLAHVEIDNGIGQTAKQTNHGFEICGSERGNRFKFGACCACAIERAQPVDHRIAEQQRCVTHGLGAAGQHQFRTPGGDVLRATIQRLQTGCAVTLHRPRRHLIATTESECYHACNIDFPGAGHDATQNNLVKILRREGLAVEQGAPGLKGQVGGMERPGFATGAQKRRAAAVNYEDWPARCEGVGLRCHELFFSFQ